MRLGRSAGTLVALVLAGCAAAPPLKLYTLSAGPSAANDAAIARDPPPQGAPAIEVERVSLPAYLDSPALLVRDGDVLERSSTGRWATRLSLEATELLAARLAMRRSDAWVTDEPQPRPPDYRLMVNISRLEITSSGAGIVEADWEIVPRSTSGEIIRRRIQFSESGPVTTDQDVVRFERSLLDQLADTIDISSLRSETPIAGAQD